MTIVVLPAAMILNSPHGYAVSHGPLKLNRTCDKMNLVINMEMPQRKPNRIDAYDYSQGGAYFITICTQDRKTILSKIVGTPVPGCPQKECPENNGHPGTGVPTTELLWHGIIADKFIRQMDAFYDHLSVDKYVIMPDHIHLLITIHEQGVGTGLRTVRKDPALTHGQSRTPVPTRANSTIAKFVGTFKRFCNKEYGENIWQGRYYDHVVRNQQDYNEIWEYIDNNPIKWALTKQP